MKAKNLFVLAALALDLPVAQRARAAHYVDLNSTNATLPYTNWATAATNIQDALDVAVAGDEIVVTNGIYASLEVDRPLTLRSVNGPQVTIIDGGHSNRCVYLTNGASLSGFTLTNGRAHYGGGLWCESTNAVVSNCVVSGNSSFGQIRGVCCVVGALAGGVYGGTLNNCILSDNRAEAVSFFGPACDTTTCNPVGGPYQLHSSPGFGGGAGNATLNNCTLTSNSAGYGGGAYGCTLNNCIVYFNLSTSGGADYHFCNLNYSCTTPLPTNGVGNITNEPAFVNLAAGNYRLRPDSPCIDAGTNLSASITNDLDGRPRPLDGNGDGLAAFDMGAYEYRTPLLVWQDSPNPTPPHSDWTTAAHAIQDAVDDAFAGDQVVVTNGIYAPVGVGKPLMLRGLNGPQFTTIDGGGSNRCVYLTNGASLSGFTLTNGSANVGAGLWCESTNAVVSNCVVSGSLSFGVARFRGVCCLQDVSPAIGGGVYGGTLNNCSLINNRAQLYSFYVPNCDLTTCHPVSGGGRSYSFPGSGGGAAYSALNNCTLTGNSAGYGGGVVGCTLNNCIAYFNTADIGTNYDSSSTLNYSCTTPLPTNGVGNITNAPLFVAQASGNLRLQSNSPCINAGQNVLVPAGPDLDGYPRIKGDTVDMGAYEFQSPASMISYAWLQQFNLPINPSTDSADPDDDGVNNYREWLAHSDPINPFSFPPLLTLIPYGANVILTWPTNAFGFTLQSTTNLGAVWSTNSPAPIVIGGQNVIVNPISGPQQAYRLRH